MKFSTKLIVTAAAVLGTAAIAGAGYAREGWSGGHGYMAKGSAHSGSFHAMGRHAVKMLERYDADGDGALTQAEIGKTRADRLARFDGDGDGKLTLGEFQGLWLEHMRSRMVDRFQAFDEDGDGTITLGEFKAPFAAMVKRRDADGDGKLSFEEMSSGRHGGMRERHRR